MINKIDDVIGSLSAVKVEYSSDARTIGKAMSYLELLKIILQNNEKLLELESLKKQDI